MTDKAFGLEGGRDADLALCVYLEPVLEARRVLVLGGLDEATSKKLARLAEEVEVLEEDALDGELELPFARGAFDAVWLTDSSLITPTAQALDEFKRVLVRAGVLIVCSVVEPDPARRRPGPPQAGLTRALLPEFLDLRMFRQSLVQAQAFQEIDVGGAIAVDTSLVRDLAPNPERIIAIASDVELRLDSSLWVQALPGTTHHEDAGLRKRLEDATERAHTLSLTLDAAEADLEDAFARARALEAQIADKDTGTAHEREHRIRAERAFEHAKAEIITEKKLVAAAETERDAARAELAGLSKECTELEERLAERGVHIQSLEQDQKRSETVARDLLEELRRIEHERTATAEHDGRIVELEAEVARAVARALEAEVAREAAQMRVDELRARVVKLEAEPTPSPVNAELEGTLYGLRTRLRELEQTIEVARQAQVQAPVIVQTPAPSARDEAADIARGQIAGLTLRLAEAESALARTSGYLGRIQGLERELEEADRFAEAHADDADRIETLEADLSRAHNRYDDLEDELRALQDDLRAARAEMEHMGVETSARVELAQRRENEARNERDHARAALEEARGILAQLTGKSSVDVTDPNVS